MKKVLALMLALVFVLSLAACGGGSTFTKDEVEKALQESESDLVLQKSSDSDKEYYYEKNNGVIEADFLVKTKDGEKVESIEITNKDIDTKLLSSEDSIIDILSKLNESGKSSINDLKAASCIIQVFDLASLFDSSLGSKVEDIKPIVTDVFTKGSCRTGDWIIRSDINSNDKTVVITAKPS